MKVLKPFTDKFTKVRYEAGSVYEGTKERVAELTEKGFIEKAEKKDKKEK